MYTCHISHIWRTLITYHVLGCYSVARFELDDGTYTHTHKYIYYNGNYLIMDIIINSILINNHEHKVNINKSKD